MVNENQSMDGFNMTMFSTLWKEQKNNTRL